MKELKLPIHRYKGRRELIEQGSENCKLHTHLPTICPHCDLAVGVGFCGWFPFPRGEEGGVEFL